MVRPLTGDRCSLLQAGSVAMSCLTGPAAWRRPIYNLLLDEVDGRIQHAGGRNLDGTRGRAGFAVQSRVGGIRYQLYAILLDGQMSTPPTDPLSELLRATALGDQIAFAELSLDQQQGFLSSPTDHA